MPGPSFCWGPALEGPRSPSSSRSSTPGQAARDRREVRRSRSPPTPARIPSSPPAPRTDPAPSRRLAPPTRRLARVACTSPPLALVCAGAQLCPSTSTRVEGGAPRRRGGGGLVRAGREGAWAPMVGSGRVVGGRWVCAEAPPRWGALSTKMDGYSGGIFYGTCGQIVGCRIAW